MKTTDFEKAIDALGVQGLEVTKFSYGQDRCVVAVYARMGERTFLMWDTNGRGFRCDAEGDADGSVFHLHPDYLGYTRDADFDLIFE